MDKRYIRKTMIQKRLVLDMSTYISDSNLIMYLVEKSKVFKEAKTIGIYVSMKQEVDTIAFIKKWCQEKEICVPKIDGKHMNFFHIRSLDEVSKGTFDVLEPCTNRLIRPEEMDIMIIPMVAFDKNKHRIGYGGGYYDRYLENYHGYKLGVAFSFQEVEEIETNCHDITLDVIIHQNSSTII